MTAPSTITFEENERLTGQAAKLFKARHVNDYFPCVVNSDKLVSFIELQLGMSIVQYPYPLQVENFEAAFEHIKATSWFYERPIEPEVEDEAAAEEARRQQRVRDEYDRQQAAAKMQRDKNMPLSQLGAEVSRQNADFRNQRDQNLLPVRTPGLESRPLSTVTMGLKATARANVALANPSLDRNGAEFSKLYAAELARLRG